LADLEIAAEYLISNGHDIDKVFKYPLKQFYEFYSLAKKRQSSENLTLLANMRTAYHAEQKAFTKLLKKMEKDNG